jgi:hypothetical protein
MMGIKVTISTILQKEKSRPPSILSYFEVIRTGESSQEWYRFDRRLLLPQAVAARTQCVRGCTSAVSQRMNGWTKQN